MKWLIFTSACVIALIALGILAVDERDVIWRGRTALCGYCRADLEVGAVVCRECDRSLDWRPATEECRWCLERKDADHLRRLYEGIDGKETPLPPSLAEYGRSYFEAIDVGACTYCGGLGKVLDGATKEPCPVCRGTKLCIACAGTRAVVVGDEGAQRREQERLEAHARAHERASVADLPVNGEVLIDEDVAALRGHVEVERVLGAGGNRTLLSLARDRLALAFRALHEEHARLEKLPGTATGGS